jgi:hypothetical protein
MPTEPLGALFVTWGRQHHAKLAPTRFARFVHFLSALDRLLGDLGRSP